MASLWIVISNQDSQSRLQELIDSGQLADAYSLQYDMQAFNDKIKSLIQEKGGHVHLFLFERIVMQVPEVVAAELPTIIASYKDLFGGKISAGVGFTFAEATKACLVSKRTGQVELYSPEEHAGATAEGELERQTPPYRLIDRNGQVTEVPPNLPTIEEDEKMTSYIMQRTMAELGLDLQQEQEAQAQMQQEQERQAQEQAMLEQQAQEELEQQMQLNEPQIQDGPPRNLLEALLGHRVPDEQEMQAMAEQQAQQQAMMEEQMMQQQAAEQQEQEPQPNEDAEMLDGVLGSAVGKIPEIMQLASQDPQSFKQAMKFLHKILDAQKKKNKDKETAKSEILDMFESLLKREGAKVRGKGTRIVYPVGTRKGRKKKVKLPSGKTTWRQMQSGMVQSETGEPISVKQYNREIQRGS